MLRAGARRSTRRRSIPTTSRAARSSRSTASRQPAPGAALQPHAAARSSGPPPHAGQHTDEVLADWGFDDDAIAKLRETGAIA